MPYTHLYFTYEEAEANMHTHSHGDMVAVGYPKAHCLYKQAVTDVRGEERRALSWLFNRIG